MWSSVRGGGPTRCWRKGMVGVYSGATGLPIHVFWGDNSQDHLGSRVAGVGDVDNDGVPDFAAGASGDDGNGDAAGAAKVFSGATGALIYEFLGESLGDQLGNAVTGAGDVNGDGHPDIGVGAIRAAYQGSQSGRAYVFSGLDGSILLRFDGAAVSDFLGGTLSGVGDVNDDGKDDLIVGATGSDLGGSSSGAAYVLSLSPWTSLGGGTAGLAGVPTLSAVGELTAGSTLFPRPGQRTSQRPHGWVVVAHVDSSERARGNSVCQPEDRADRAPRQWSWRVESEPAMARRHCSGHEPLRAVFGAGHLGAGADHHVQCGRGHHALRDKLSGAAGFRGPGSIGDERTTCCVFVQMGLDLSCERLVAL